MAKKKAVGKRKSARGNRERSTWKKRLTKVLRPELMAAFAEVRAHERAAEHKAIAARAVPLIQKGLDACEDNKNERDYIPTAVWDAFEELAVLFGMRSEGPFTKVKSGCEHTFRNVGTRTDSSMRCTKCRRWA